MKELDYLDTKNYKDLPDDIHQRMIQNSREYILEEKISELQEEIDRLRLLIIEWADAYNALSPNCIPASNALRKEVGR